MKKTIYLCVLMCALIFFAVSCSGPSAGLSDRDYSELYSQYNYDAEKNNDASIVTPGSFKPVLQTYSVRPTNTSNPDGRKVEIKFPREADVLQAEKPREELAKFLSFYSFNAAADSYSASTSASTYDYDFVQMDSSGYIVVELKSIPGDKNLVMKIDGTKYTFSGKNTLNLLGNEQDKPIYNDVYAQIMVLDEGDVSVSSVNYVEPGNKSWSITITAPSNSNFTTLTPITEQTIYAASLNSTYGSSFTDTARETILGSVRDKLKLQKFDNKTGKWADMGNAFSYDSLSSTIIVKYTPEDLALYRIKVSGIKNFKTSGEYYGVQQKIKLNSNIYDVDSFVTNTAISMKDDDHIQATGPNSASVVSNSSDIDGKNLVLTLRFTLPGSPTVGLSSMALADFNKCFKIAVHSGSFSGTSTSNSYFVKIEKVEYTGDNKDTIKLTIDPNYKGESGKNVSFLISPSFKYADSKYYLGSYNNYDWDIDGERFFGIYQVTP